MKKILLSIILLLSTPAFAEEWVVIKTTKTYQIKIVQPYEKYEDYTLVWSKLLFYNRVWYVSKIMWDCDNKKYRLLTLIAGYSDEPPTVDYGIMEPFQQIENNSINDFVYKEVCK